jgi:hypothetical protein
MKRREKGYCKKRTVGKVIKWGEFNDSPETDQPLTNYLQILLLIIGSGKSNKALYNGEFDPGSG